MGGVKTFLVVMPKMVFLSALLAGLGGCRYSELANAIAPAVTLSSGTVNDDILEREIAAFRDGDSRLGTWQNLLGENFLYVPDDYQKQYTSSADYFLGAVLGSYLANNPEITNEYLNKYCVPLCTSPGLIKQGIENGRMDYLRRWGAAWQRSLRETAEAQVIAERYELFKRRASSFGPYSYASIRALIRNDADLRAFLQDDAFAKRWIAANTTQTEMSQKFFNEYLNGTNLAPITVPHLPGLAS